LGGTNGYWWTATQDDIVGKAMGQACIEIRKASGISEYKSRMLSVRCLQDYYVAPSPSKGNNIANYKTVRIGNQVWMAENLDYNVNGSKCYNKETANCTTYGRLYSWAIAMALPDSCNSSYCGSKIKAKHRGICPSGWHIPSHDEWTTLMNFVGGASTAGTKLKSTSGWSSNGNGTDAYGFSALPGGYAYSGRFGFSDVGNVGYWCSATETKDIASYAYGRVMYYNSAGVDSGYSGKADLYSVRCVQD